MFASIIPLYKTQVFDFIVILFLIKANGCIMCVFRGCRQRIKVKMRKMNEMR